MQPRTHSSNTFVRSIAEIRAFGRYTYEALELQRLEEDLHDHGAAALLIEHTADVLRLQTEHLDRAIGALDGALEALKKATASLAPVFLGFFSKTRAHDTSAMLRDDYTLLSLISTSYVMLHSTAQASHREDWADLALTHHRELSGLVRAIAKLLPRLVLNNPTRTISSIYGSVSVPAEAEEKAAIIPESR